MLGGFLKKIWPTPTSATALSLLALVVAGYAANGGNFLLGLVNSATQRTALSANHNGTALRLNNTSTRASAVPLQLTVAAGHPPMKVNTVTKVTNLNVDYVDGLDSATLTHAIRVNYSLAAGATSAPITVPIGVPAQLVGVNVSPTASVGQASLHSLPAGQIEWLGLSEGAVTTVVRVPLASRSSISTTPPKCPSTWQAPIRSGYTTPPALRRPARVVGHDGQGRPMRVGAPG